MPVSKNTGINLANLKNLNKILGDFQGSITNLLSINNVFKNEAPGKKNFMPTIVSALPGYL